jgi:hypothetical protein
MFRHPSFLCILLSGLLCLEAVAQRTCRILFLGAPDDAPESLQLFDGTGSREVALPRMNFSEVYSLPSGAITLRLLEKAPEKPEVIPAGSPKAAIGENVTDFYLLISADPKNETLPVSMQVIDANATSFRKGQMMWFNLTDSRVGGKLGSQKLALEPNSRETTSAPASKGEDYPVDIYFQRPGAEKAWPLCETVWRHDPSARSVMFVLPQGAKQAPRIMSFSDFRMEENNGKRASSR